VLPAGNFKTLVSAETLMVTAWPTSVEREMLSGETALTVPN